MRIPSALVFRVLFFAIATGVLSAQRARITGRTHALGDTARVVPDAEVTLLPDARTVRSDSAGMFSFARVADGMYQIRVRRLGFEESQFELPVTGQHDRSVLLPMRANVQALGEVVIAGQRVMFPARYAEAYQRITHESGDFFTREKIDSLNPLDMKSLLRTIPGVQVNERGINFQRCQGDPFAPGGPAGPPTSLSGAQPSARTSPGGPAQAAHVQVYVDGVLVTRTGNSDRDASHELQNIPPTSVQLMQVYRGVARIPGQYLADACAVVLVWTK